MFSLYSLRHFILLTPFSLLQTTLASAVYPRLDNGLAITPPMGWNSYNHYSCSPNESIITSNAQALVDLGLLDLGYHYATVDCGWTLPNRTANGTLTWNPALFPSGYPALGDFIHSLGLKFGVYSDGGIQMCMTGTPAQAGSLGHETTDADTFAAWGADLLKYDNCYSDAALDYPDTSYTPSVSPKDHYVTMSAAVLATGREIAFQICDWGVDFPSAWAPALGNTWRITNDIIPAYRTIPRILNQAVPQTSFAGPGQWLDLDMLEVGNSVFTTDEEKTHFSLWAIIKSPLVIGCALKDTITSINANSLAILKNTDVISYNQDSLGVAASFRRRWTEDEYEVWAGPLSGDRYVIALINNADVERELTLDLPVVGLQKVGWLKDVWNNVTVTDVKTSYSGTVGAHGVLLVEVGELTASGIYNVEDSVLLENSRKFTDIYGITTSNNYTATYTLTNGTIINDSITLNTTDTNTLTTSLPLTGNLTITPPPSTFYPSTQFTTTGSASLTTCYTGLCAPVGSKITYLGGADSNTASTTLTSPKTSISGSKYVEIYFCNNDIALATSWGSGTNTRNLTIGVNGVTTRIEVPLSGKSSELYSPGLGWEDTGIFGVVLDGLFEGEGAVNDVVVGNVGGVDGIVEWGADFVGLDVWW